MSEEKENKAVDQTKSDAENKVDQKETSKTKSSTKNSESSKTKPSTKSSAFSKSKKSSKEEPKKVKVSKRRKSSTSKDKSLSSKLAGKERVLLKYNNKLIYDGPSEDIKVEHDGVRLDMMKYKFDLLDVIIK